MPGYLRQSTAVDIKLGPFVDATDAVTAETGLTLSQADIRLKKNAAAWAQKTQSSSATHEENGNYEVSLDTTDTNTLGLLYVHVAESGALPVWDTFTVIPADLYDTMFTANANRSGVLVSGTIGSTGNSTTALHLTGLTYGDDELNGFLLVIKDVSANERHSRWIDDWADTGDLATVATLPFTPENSVDTYEILATRKDVNTTHAAGTAWNSGAIGAATLASDTIAAAKIASGAITSAKFAAGAIDASAIADNAIDAGAIASDAITAAKIANGAIDAATFAADVDAEILSYIVDDATRIDASALNTATVTTIPAVNTAVAALQTYPKNVAIAAFMFYLEDTDGAALTGATVSTFISKDGGAFAATATATATEVSHGWYKVALTQTEANCDELAFRATATGARTCNIKARMQG